MCLANGATASFEMNDAPATLARLRDAEAMLERARGSVSSGTRFDRAMYPTLWTQVASLYQQLAESNLKSGRFDAALSLVDRGLTILERDSANPKNFLVTMLETLAHAAAGAIGRVDVDGAAMAARSLRAAAALPPLAAAVRRAAGGGVDRALLRRRASSARRSRTRPRAAAMRDSWRAPAAGCGPRNCGCRSARTRRRDSSRRSPPAHRREEDRCFRCTSCSRSPRD